MHCHDIERLIAAGTPYTVSHYGDVGPSDLADEIEDAEERYAAELEAIREDLCTTAPSSSRCSRRAARPYRAARHPEQKKTPGRYASVLPGPPTTQRSQP